LPSHFSPFGGPEQALCKERANFFVKGSSLPKEARQKVKKMRILLQIAKRYFKKHERPKIFGGGVAVLVNTQDDFNNFSTLSRNFVGLRQLIYNNR